MKFHELQTKIWYRRDFTKKQKKHFLFNIPVTTFPSDSVLQAFIIAPPGAKISKQCWTCKKEKHVYGHKFNAGIKEGIINEFDSSLKSQN